MEADADVKGGPTGSNCLSLLSTSTTKDRGPMRQIRIWAATLCALVLMAACTDSPTGPLQRLDGSYFTVPFSITAQGPCSLNGNLNAPQGAVGWVHTHPFTTGEVQTICGAIKQPDPSAPGGFRDAVGPNGQPLYPVYDNRPSFPDHELMNDMNATRAQLGQPLLAGVIIDANQTTVYTENPADGTTVLPRCGY